MCLRRRQLDPKSRRILAAGNLCLSSGLMLTLFFEHGFGHRHPAIFDALRFLLIGCAISLPALLVRAPQRWLRCALLKGTLMLQLDSCSLKKSLPIAIALLVVAQIDLASAAGWPNALLSLLHLMAAPDDLCRGVCAGIGTSIDVLVVFQLARMWAKRAMQPERDPRHN